VSGSMTHMRFKPAHIMNTQDKNVYKHTLCHNVDAFGLNSVEKQQQTLSQS
jgi:hypothetical protein